MSDPQLSLLVLYSSDLPRLVRFYSALGLRFTEERHDSGPTHYAAPRGNVVLELYPLHGTGDAERSGSLRLGFRVESIDMVLRELAQLGVQPRSAPRITEWGRTAVVQDPEGRKVELTEALDSR